MLPFFSFRVKAVPCWSLAFWPSLVKCVGSVLSVWSVLKEIYSVYWIQSIIVQPLGGLGWVSHAWVTPSGGSSVQKFIAVFSFQARSERCSHSSWNRVGFCSELEGHWVACRRLPEQTRLRGLEAPCNGVLDFCVFASRGSISRGVLSHV